MANSWYSVTENMRATTINGIKAEVFRYDKNATAVEIWVDGVSWKADSTTLKAGKKLAESMIKRISSPPPNEILEVLRKNEWVTYQYKQFCNCCRREKPKHYEDCDIARVLA